MSIAVGVSATKAGFDLIKSARELLTRGDINPGEVQSRLLELQALMLEAQRALGEAEEENRSLKREIGEMKRAQAVESDLEFEQGVYWYKGWPFCPNCWLRKKELSRLTGPYGMDGHYQCQFDSAQYNFSREPKDKGQ